jgi:hypothetical protein
MNLVFKVIIGWIFAFGVGSFVYLAQADEQRTNRVIENPVQDGNMILRINDGGVKKDSLLITGSTGEVTFPQGFARTGDTIISAYDSADQSITESGVTLNFGSESIDTLGEFSSNTFTATKAGNYRVTVHGSLVKSSGTSTIDTFQAIIRKNGAQFANNPQISAAVTTFAFFSNTAIVPLTVGQTITAALFPNFGGGRTFSGSVRGATISIERI